jgi:TPR repeat protein
MNRSTQARLTMVKTLVCALAGAVLLSVFLAPAFLHAQSNSAPAVVLECSFGQKGLTEQLRSADAIKAAAAALKDAAKTDETARNQRLQLAIESIDAAMLVQSVGRDPSGYWALMKNDLADTRWRLVKAGKSGSEKARWAFAELSQHESAKTWDAKACESLGVVQSKTDAGLLYRAALCLSAQAPEKALPSMQAAADAGHPAAQEAYGRLCAGESPMGSSAKVCAVKYLCLAADAGRVSAAGLAAFLITEQKPSAGMAVKAAALYEKAVNSGDLASANNLGEVYELGWIGKTDWVKAEQFYRVAAQANVPQAQLNLARLIANKDRAQALMWIEKARVSMPNEADQLLKKLPKR